MSSYQTHEIRIHVFESGFTTIRIDWLTDEPPGHFSAGYDTPKEAIEAIATQIQRDRTPTP